MKLEEACTRFNALAGIPFGELFSRLKDMGFTGAVLLENYSKDYASEDELRASFEYLARLAERTL